MHAKKIARRKNRRTKLRSTLKNRSRMLFPSKINQLLKLFTPISRKILLNHPKRRWPKSRRYLAKVIRITKRRPKRRRFRKFLQKTWSLRKSQLVNLGRVVSRVNYISKAIYKNKQLRLPFSRKPKDASRWIHSYPYLFTNAIQFNKHVSPSVLTSQVSKYLTPTRGKRARRSRLTTIKKLRRSKSPYWKRLITRSNDSSVKNVKTYKKHFPKPIYSAAVLLRKKSLPVTPIKSKSTKFNYWSFSKHKFQILRKLRNVRSAHPSRLKQKKSIKKHIKSDTFLQLSSLKSFKSYRQVVPVNKANFKQQPLVQNLNPKHVIRKAPQWNKFSDSPIIMNHSILVTKQRSLPPLMHQVTDYSEKVKLITRTRLNFTLRAPIMFFTKLLLHNNKNPYTYKYVFKKKLFSFLYPNQVRNALLVRKKKLMFYRLVYKTKQTYKTQAFYWPRNLRKHFERNERIKWENQSDSLFSQSKSLLKTTKQLPNDLEFNSFTQEHFEISDDHHFSLRGTDNSFKTVEVRIPRIRFKPGYQRLWRQARTALQESLKLRFIYQKKLSRYVTRFFGQTNYYTFSRSEMSLEKTIMYSRLLPDLPTIHIFLNQRLIYLNGKFASTMKASVFQNDLIQLIVSKWYYIAYRWIANWTVKRHKKFKRLVYRKGLAGKHKVMKLRKQRSYYTPHWIYLARYDISDIKPYLEVDYLTLSAFVIYNPYLLYYYSPDDTPDLRSTIYRMYNWKYIT